MQRLAAIAIACLAGGCGRLDFDDAMRPDAAALDARADADPRLAPCAGAIIFDDDFDVNDPAPVFRISTSASPIGVVETNSTLVFDLTGPFTAGTYKGYRTLVRYPLSALCVVVDVTQLPTGNTTSGFVKVFDTSRVAEVFFYNDGAQPLLTSRTQVNASGGGGTIDHYVPIPYDAALHRFWRLQQVGRTTYWDASADGMEYTELTRLDDVFLDSDAFIEVGAGTETAGSNGGAAAFARITASGP